MPLSSLLCLNSVRPSTLEWLWPGRLPRGKLAVLDGDPGCGKSLLTIDLAARLSRGLPLPNGEERSPAQRTLFLNAEDAVEDTLLPRLQAAGADLQNVFCIGGGQPQAAEASAFELPRDLPELESRLAEHRIDLLVIDPLVAFLSPGCSMTHDQTVRRALVLLAVVAARRNATVLLVRHLTKRGGSSSLYRGSGSIGVIGSVRSGLLAARHPKRNGYGVLASSKANLGEPAPSLLYQIRHSADGLPTVVWQGPIEMGADELCHPTEQAEPGLLRAAEWLLQALASGPRPAKELLHESQAAGFSERTLARTKHHLKIASNVATANGKRCWIWSPPVEPRSASLPPDRVRALDDLPPLDLSPLESSVERETISPFAAHPSAQEQLARAEKTLLGGMNRKGVGMEDER